MHKNLSGMFFALVMILTSPLFAFADEAHTWVLWQEVVNQNAIMYPNPQNPSTEVPFAEALAQNVFSSREDCENQRTKMVQVPTFLAKGWPYFFICLPNNVRPFYFSR